MENVAARICQEAVSQPVLSCVIWTSTNRMTGMAGDWKLSSMGCLCSEAPSWRWTQHSSAPSMALARQEDELLTKMGSLLLPRSAKESWGSKSVGVGLTKPSDS